MKQKLLCVLFVLLQAFGFAQNLITNVTISLPNNPPANTSNWASTLPPILIAAKGAMQNGQLNGMVIESKMLVTIKRNGAKVCGMYTKSTAPSANFTTAVKTWNGSEVVNMLGQECTLQPGSYELCVQFFSMNTPTKDLSLEVCKPFTIADAATPPNGGNPGVSTSKFTPPINIAPANGKSITEKEAKAPLTFRWTPIVPKPQSVKYRLKVWQLMQGQNGTQAMKTNQPVITKDVDNITQYVKPNLLGDIEMIDNKADLVWNVEALNENGSVLGKSEGTVFGVSSSSSGCSHTAKIKSIECLQIVNGLQQYNVCVEYKNTATIGCSNCTILLSNPNNYPGIGGGGVTIVSTNPSTTINSIASGVPSTLTAGNQTTICFTASVASGNNLKFQVHATCNDAYISQPEIDRNHENSLFDTIPPSCKCTTCDQITFNLGQETSSFNPSSHPWDLSDNNHLYLTQPIITGPTGIKVVQVKAEVVDFYWYTELEDCKKCVNNSYYWGNLIKGSTNSVGFNTSGTNGTDDAGVPLPNSHEMQFISSTPTGATFNGNIRLQLSLPPQTELSCCVDCFRFCIRYTIVFMENGVCKTCTKVKCYEVKRQHRKSMFVLYPPPNECGDPGVIIFNNPSVDIKNPKVGVLPTKKIN